MWGVSYFRLNVPCQMDWKRERRKNERFRPVLYTLEIVYIYKLHIPCCCLKSVSFISLAPTRWYRPSRESVPAVDIISPFVCIVVVDISTHVKSFSGQNIYNKKKSSRDYISFFPAGAQHHVAWCTECGAKGHIISLYLFFFFFFVLLIPYVVGP